MNRDLLWIKKNYGEEFSHLCRELFPTLLETEGFLPELLDTHIAHTKFLYDDVVSSRENTERFINYIYSLLNIENETEEEIIDVEEPSVLLEKAGYDFYECKTYEELLSFRKYYAPDEELCSFRQEDKLDNYYVFFAVRKDVDSIRRCDFEKPVREDKYGTSVLSIQFSKGSLNTVTIVSRYNHGIEKPNATYGNNLDSIISGLTDSFIQHYNFNIKNSKNDGFLPGYEMDANGRYHKYNYEYNGVYYCPSNIIMRIRCANKLSNSYIVMDRYILDLKKRKIANFSDDSFVKTINDFDIKKITYNKDKEFNKIINLYIEDNKKITIKLNKCSQIIGYTNNYVEKVGNWFLQHNTTLQEIEMNSLKSAGYGFLSKNNVITSISFPELKNVGDHFMYENTVIEQMDLPKLKLIGSCFLYNNNKLEEVYLPNLFMVSSCFLSENNSVVSVVLPKARTIGDAFFYSNQSIKKIELPRVVEIESGFLKSNLLLRKLELPNVVYIGSEFLQDNEILESLSLPMVKKVDSHFMESNNGLMEIDLPSIKKLGDRSLMSNKFIKKVSMPKVREIGYNVLTKNIKIVSLSLPSVRIIYNNFLESDKNIREINMPVLQSAGSGIMSSTNSLRKLNVPQEMLEYFEHMIPSTEEETISKNPVYSLRKV